MSALVRVQQVKLAAHLVNLLVRVIAVVAVVPEYAEQIVQVLVRQLVGDVQILVKMPVVLNVHISVLQNALAVVKTVVKMDVLHAAEAVGVGVKLNVVVLAL